MSCFWGHKWDKWEQFEEQRIWRPYENGWKKEFRYTAKKQKRKCKKCNLKEERIIDGMD
jgi:hypothetical protein